MNRSLVFIALALLTWGVGEGMFFNFVPIYLDNVFLLSERQIGLVLGIFSLSMTVMHLPGGHLSDRIGRKPLLVFAWLLGMASALTMGFAKTLPLYMVGLIGYGMTAFVSAPLGSYMTAARGSLPVATALSLTTITFSAGMALGPWLGGQISEQWGMRMAYVIGGVIFILSTVFIVLVERQPIDHHDESNPPVRLWSNQRFTGFLAVVAFAYFAMHLAQPLTPNYLEQARGLSLSDVGVVFSWGALGNALVTVVLSRYTPRWSFLAAQALVALFALCMWLGTGVPMFALGYFLLGGLRASRPLFFAQARDVIPASQMGLAYGAIETVMAVVTIITPIAAGYIFKPDPTLVYRIAIGLVCAAVVVSYLFVSRQAGETQTTLNERISDA